MSLFDNDDDMMDAADEKEAAIAAPSVPPSRANTALVSHEEVEQQLLQWWQSGAMPHAIILSGARGIGKATLAFRLARFLLANPVPPAGDMFGPAVMPKDLSVPATHPSHALIASGGHPDVMDIARTANEKTGQMHSEILVDEVREVPLFLRRTASEGGWRVVIVDEAETLNRNAQNALLKILEEPPPRAVLILVTQTIGAFLPTIRSRARVVPMDAPDAAQFATLLRSYRPDLTTGDIETLAQVSGNAPGQALELLEQGGMGAIRETLGLLEKLPAAADAELWQLAEKLAVKATPDPLTGMLDLSTWALRDRARRAGASDAVPALKAALTTLDALERHRHLCENGNLDRRHMALGALRILQSGLRAA